MGNLEKMIFYAKKSNHWRNQILGETKLSNYKNVLLLSNRPASDPRELTFLIQHCFSSYIKLLERVPRDNLYKLFVSVRGILPSATNAIQKISAKMNSDSNKVNVAEFIKITFTAIISEMPTLVQKPKFYTAIMVELENNEKKIKSAIESFI